MQKQWSCGCIEVDGQLAEECTQVQPSGPLQSHQRSLYSPVCYRKRVEVSEPSEPLPVDAVLTGDEVGGTTVTPEAADGVQS